MRDRFPDDLPISERLWFSLAAYNAGVGHVHSARRLAKQIGLDPNRWFGHTEEAMLLLSRKEYAEHSRYGYVNGREPVNYVRDIRQRFEAYLDLSGDLADREGEGGHNTYFASEISIVSPDYPDYVIYPLPGL